MNYYLGIDLHKQFAYWHCINEAGDVIWSGKVPCTESDTNVRLQQLAIPLGSVTAAIESVEHYGWYADLLKQYGIGTVHLANPHKLRLIAENPLKNDKKDAAIIAQYLRSGTLPLSYLAPQEIRNLRELVRTRMYLAKQRSAHKVRIRNALAKHGLSCRYKDIDGQKAKAWLTTVTIPDEHRQEITSLLTVMQALTTEIEHFEGEMKKRGTQYPEVQILKTIPGIADIRALIIMAEVGDFTRFKRPEQLAAFAGLVPRSFSSGGQERLGRITKRGSSLLRHALVQAAQQAHPNWGDLYVFKTTLKEKRHTGAAKVALARKLITIAWYLVQRNEPFVARLSEPSGGVNTI